MSPTRRDFLTATAAADQDVPRGRRDAYVMLSARNWHVHTGELGTEPAAKDDFWQVSLIRLRNGEWVIMAMPEKGSDQLIDIMTVDDPGAVAFLETFAELMTAPPPRGRYRWSELARR